MDTPRTYTCTLPAKINYDSSMTNVSYPLLYPPYLLDRGMLWFYVEAARRPPPTARRRRPPPAARRPQWC